MMKKVISLLLALTFIFALGGCTKKDMGRIMYNLNLKKFVELSEYKGIEIDTESDEFKEYVSNVISADVQALDLYVKITEGVLKDGDVANIDYIGKLDGVAFEGGTAKGYNLELGSGSFIDGFEEKLVGVKIGSTVDLNLTFPDPYDNNPDLAGEDVVFTVTVNYVKTEEERKPEDYFSEISDGKYKTVEEYYDEVEVAAAKNFIITKVLEESKVNKYPEEERQSLLEQRMEYLELYVQNYYGITLESYLTSSGQTMEEFEESTLTNYVEPMMQEQMVFYAILDNEKIEITDKEIEDKTKEYIASYNDSTLTEDVVKQYNGDYYFEYLLVSEKVVDFLYENAKIS